MHAAIRWLDILFGRGDSDYPFWLLTVRINVLLFVLCSALVIASQLSPARLRQALRAKQAIGTVLALTALAAVLRFLVARPNLLDYGGIAYSRLLLGYKGYFGTAQFYSLLYGLTARDIEHAILFDRVAGTLTIPLVYVLCRRLQPGTRLAPAIAAFLFAVYPLHILFSASDALAIFSLFLAAASYVMLARPGLGPWAQHDRSPIHYLGGFAGLALLTQVRYENLLFLVPPALVWFAHRPALRLRELIPPLVVPATFVVIYAYEATTSGFSYEESPSPWHNLDLVIRHLVLNPFMAVPVLLIGTVAIGKYKGLRLGAVALLPWVGVLILCVLTSGDGHGAARIYANWLILILPLAGYGFAVMLTTPGQLAKAVAAVALLYLGAQPLILRDRLAAQHLEIAENDYFKALLTNPPPGTNWIIVPDDDVLRRHAHSTLEVFNKYVMTLGGIPEPARRVGLVGLTAFLERPEQTSCASRACVFFFGLPCLEQDVYPFVHGQCQELLRTRRAALLEETTVNAAPFVHCSIYTGTLRQQLCDPATKAQRFAVYRIEETR